MIAALMFPLNFVKTIRQLSFFGEEMLSKHLVLLRRRGANGQRALYETWFSRHFIQAKKYISNNGEAGVDLVIPLADIYGDIEEDLRTAASQLRLAVKKVPSTSDFAFLFIDLGHDESQYYPSLRLLLRRMKIGTKAIFRIASVPQNNDSDPSRYTP